MEHELFDGKSLNHDRAQTKHTALLSHCAVLYFVCSDREQIPAYEAQLKTYALSKKHRIYGTFYDRQGEPPFVFINLIEIFAGLPNVSLIIPSRKHLSIFGISCDAIEYHASQHGIHIVYIDREMPLYEADTKKPSEQALRYLEFIDNYLGYGKLRDTNLEGRSNLHHKQNTYGRLPLGYCIKNSKVQISERHAEAVKEIFRLFAEDVSVSDIEKQVVAKFTDIKCPTRNQIYFIVANSRYIGDDTYGTMLQPIIPNNLWLAARGSAFRRGMRSNEYCFIFQSIGLIGKGRLKPMQYCRMIHASAYVAEINDMRICVDAAEVENAVLIAAERILAINLDNIKTMCKAAAKEAEYYKKMLLNICEELSGLRSQYYHSSLRNFSARYMVSEYDKHAINIKLTEITMAYERKLVRLLSRTDEEIDAFFKNFERLNTLSNHEKSYFLAALIKDVAISDDEISIICCLSKTKRFHIKSKIKISEQIIKSTG